eukprot:SAG31_NODE_1239_length_9169_cov_18.922492_5_plen_102_part_00
MALRRHIKYAHSRPAADDLFAAGWISSKTRAIMHDFTIYSAPAHLYVNVRLVIEIGVDHGSYRTSLLSVGLICFGCGLDALMDPPLIPCSDVFVTIYSKVY